MRTRRATSLLFAAAALCAVFTPSFAGDPPTATVPGGVLRAGASNTPINSEPGRRLKADLLAHEQKVVDHLTGTKTATFAGLKVRQAELESALQQAGDLPADERAALVDDLHRIARLLVITEPLARRGDRLPPGMEKILKESSRDAKPVDALLVIGDQLRLAASDPSSAPEVFDALRRTQGGADLTPAVLAGVLAEVKGADPIPYSASADVLKNRARLYHAANVPAPRVGETRLAAPVPAAPVPTATTGDALITSASAALTPYLRVAGAGETQFATERIAMRVKLLQLADAAGARSTGDLEAAVATLARRVEALHLGPEPDPGTAGFPDAMMARIKAIREGRQDATPPVPGDVPLSDYVAALWDYRLFIRRALSAAMRDAPNEVRVPTGAKFKPWEVQPLAAGFVSAEFTGVTHAGVAFLGLTLTRENGSATFSSRTNDGKERIQILRDRLGEMEIVHQSFDGDKPRSQLLDKLDKKGRLELREAFDFTSHNVKREAFGADGHVVRTETMEGASGLRKIEDHVTGVITEIDRDKNVRIKSKPAPAGTPPVATLRVGMIDAYGNFSMQRMVMQDGKQIVVHTKQILQILDDHDTTLGWNVDVMAVVNASGAEKYKQAQLLAHDIVEVVFGKPADAGRVTALAGYLMDKAVAAADAPDPSEGPSVRLSISPVQGKKLFELLIAHKDKTATAVDGIFHDVESYRGRRTPAFGVVAPVKVGIGGKRDPSSGFDELEYLFDGSRLQVSETTEHYEPGALASFFKNAHPTDTPYTYYQKFTRRGGDWSTTETQSSQWDKVPGKPVEGLSFWGGVATSRPMQWVGTATSVVTTTVRAGYADTVGYLTDSDAIKLEGTLAWRQNPIVAAIRSDDITAGINGRQAEILNEGAGRLRAENLDRNNVTESNAPIQRLMAMQTPISGNELKAAAVKYSASEQLAREGHGGLAILYEAGGQGLELVAVGYLGGEAFNLAGKAFKGLSVMAEGTAAARAIPMLTKVGGFAVKAADASMLAFTGGMVVSDVSTLVDHWGDAKMYGDIGRVAADAGMLGFLAWNKMSEPKPAEIPKTNIPPVEPTPAPAPVAPTPVEPAPLAVRPEVQVRTFDPPAPVDPVQPPARTFRENLGLEPDAHPDVVKREFVRQAGELQAPAGGGSGEANARLRELIKGYKDFKAEIRGPELPADPKIGTRMSENPGGAGPSSNPTAALPAPEPRLALPAPSGEPRLALPAPEGHAPVPEGRAALPAPEGSGTPVSRDLVVRPADGPLVAEARPAPRGAAETAPLRLEGSNPEYSGPRRLTAPEEGSFERTAGPRGEGETGPKRLGASAEDGGVRRAPEGEDPAARRPAEAKPGEEVKPGEEAKPGEEVKPEDRKSLRERAKDAAKNTRDWIADRAPAMARLAAFARPSPNMPAPVKAVKDAAGDVVPVEAAPEPGARHNPDTTPPDPTTNDDNAPTDPVVNDGGVNNNAPTNANNNAPTGPYGTAGGGAGGGSSASAPADRHPSVKGPGGFGGKGGGGGGAGGGGGGAGGGGGSGNSGDGSPRGGGSAPAADIGSAAPAGARPAAFVPPSVKAPKSAATGNGFGGHSPEPSIAARFDGSKDRGHSSFEWSPTPMKGLGAGGDGGLPKLGGARAEAPKAPATKDGALSDATAASATAGAAPAGSPAAARPEDEDYGYTYLSPAKHKYELPTDHPGPGNDWRYLIDLALRASAVLAVIYLVSHSDLPYLVGFTRRRRKND